MRVWMVLARGERTQAAVAKAAGMGQSYYCLIENGKRRPSLRAAFRLAAALQVDWRRFFEEERYDDVEGWERDGPREFKGGAGKWCECAAGRVEGGDAGQF